MIRKLAYIFLMTSLISCVSINFSEQKDKAKEIELAESEEPCKVYSYADYLAIKLNPSFFPVETELIEIWLSDAYLGIFDVRDEIYIPYFEGEMRMVLVPKDSLGEDLIQGIEYIIKNPTI